jgi:hypothetical protein
MHKASKWRSVPGAQNALTFQYSFGGGVARSFAVMGPKGWIVVSPPRKLGEADVSTLEEQGPIAALVAPNAFHHMGLGPWREKYPDAQIFAPKQSLARVQKKSGLSVIRDVAEAEEHCGDTVELLDMPHYRTGELLVRAKGDQGSIWHVTDVIFNWTEVPPKFMAKLIFTVLSDSAPGFKLCGPAALMMMRDKKAVYRWLKEEAAKKPPVVIVPSHGADLILDPPGKQLVDLLTIQGRV